MTVPAQVLAAVRSIPHPRQEPDMTAPHPSPAEQAVIDRFGIFEAEERGLPALLDDLRESLIDALDGYVITSRGEAEDAAQSVIDDVLAPLLGRLTRAEAAVRAVEGLAEQWANSPLHDLPVYSPETFADHLRSALTAPLASVPHDADGGERQ